MEEMHMAAIVYQTDKRSGITYAYESVSHWDKENQQSRAKRTLIGRVDAETGKIIPTRKKAEQEATNKPKHGQHRSHTHLAVFTEPFIFSIPSVRKSGFQMT
jgi:hypothetical protein